MTVIDFPLAGTASVPERVPVRFPSVPTCEARELGERIIALAGRVASAQCRWLLLVAQFDAADGADAYGLPTTTRWLSHHCGISARTVLGRDTRRFTGCLDPERAALLDAALDAVQASAPDGEQLSAADALVRMAEITLATLADSPAPRRLPRGHEQVALVLHLHAVRQVSPEVVSENEADTASVEAGAVQTVTQDAPASGRGSREPLRSCLARPATQEEPEPADPSKAYTDVADPIAGIAPGPQPAASDGTAPAGGSREPSRSPSARPVARLADGPGIPGAVLERLTCAGRVRVVVHDPVHPRDVLDLGRSGSGRDLRRR